MRSCVRILVWGTPLLSLLWAAPAYAQDSPLYVEWSAPLGCPSKDELIVRVRAIAGALALSDPRLRVQIVVQRNATFEFSALLHTDFEGVEGTRELRGASCAEVTDAAALVLALMLKPAETNVTPAPEAEVEPTAAEPVPAPAPPTPPKKAERVAPEEEKPVQPSVWAPHVFARAGVGAGVGLLPGLATAVVVHAGVSAHWAALELRAGYWLPKSANVADSPGIGGRLSSVEGGGLGCARPSFSDWRFDSCVGLALSRMSGEGQGATETSRGSAVVGAALLEQAVERHLWENVGLRLSVEAVVPMARPRFSIEDAGEIHRPAALVWRAAVSGEVEF